MPHAVCTVCNQISDLLLPWTTEPSHDLNPLSQFWTYFQIAILYLRHPPHIFSKMAITILPPVVDDVDIPHPDSDHDSMSVDSDGGVDLEHTSRPSKRTRTVGGTKIGAGVVTPGEVVTDDPQWMRLVFPFCRRTQLGERANDM